jgi:UDP-N-acetylmuramoylalanine--D-glutamate ligase
MEAFRGKTVFVVGTGRSGLSSALLLLREGARVTLVDERPVSAVVASLGREIPPGAAFLHGRMDGSAARTADLVVLSPGIPPDRLPREALAERGVPVWGEIELGFRRFRGRLAAVTGTNGKSTVTTLLGAMASRTFPRVFVGGNLGDPLVEAAGEPYDWGIVEVSSFQLESIEAFRPEVAVLLNITEDHMDRYPDFAAYAGAKAAIFRNQGAGDTAVFNADDPEAIRAVASVASGRILFSVSRPLPEGVFLSGDDIVRRAEGMEERYPRSLLRIRGVQNVENAMAAVAAARRIGVPPGIVRETLFSFAGLPHRVEFVREIGGVSFYNDSKGTNVGAVIKCLEGFEESVVLIAGGKDKGVDFRPLRGPLGRKARAAVLFGEARGRMERELSGAAPLLVAESLEDAVRRARAAAHRGDAVVLSPACSSFDMFRSFEERGEAFRRAVMDLPR